MLRHVYNAVASRLYLRLDTPPDCSVEFKDRPNLSKIAQNAEEKPRLVWNEDLFTFLEGVNPK